MKVNETNSVKRGKLEFTQIYTLKEGIFEKFANKY